MQKYREQTDGCRKAGGWGTGWKGEGMKEYFLLITKQSQVFKVQHRKIGSNIVQTMYDIKWVLDLPGDHFLNNINI